MSIRPQHVHDGGIVERRLRPIYDWLDTGNNKKALQEAEKVLKKSPALQAARALKSLALLRLGKNGEAYTVLETLAEEKPSDDTTLQAMTICYRESQQLWKVCTLYEAAVKSEPCNEELHSHLFMSYVRIGDFRAQQRAAMALYKFAPKNPYYFWAVMSIILQAKNEDDRVKKGVLLSLAQRMVDIFINDNKMEAEQEARLYVMILELQEKWEDILKFMEGPLYPKLVLGAMPQASLPYLRRLGMWRRLNYLSKELLWDNQDRWDYYQPYFDSVFHLFKFSECEENSVDESNDSTIDDTPEKCHEFLCLLIESMGSGRVLRGPYLARLELWRRLADAGEATSLLGSPVALCIQYLRVFGHKPCAVPDLRPFLAMIPQQEREEHCRDFLTCLSFDENSEPETLDDVQRHINCMGVWRLCAGDDGTQPYTLGTIFRRHYLRALRTGLVASTLTELCAADAYAVLAAHHYYYAAIKQQSSEPILDALSLLELAIQRSPANFHAKLLLVKMYHMLGNALAADTIHQRLDVKHVQMVSLGWLHESRLAPACAPTRALRLLADTHFFHSHYAKDSVEHLTYAYKYGTFEKLVELLAWQSRIERCAWCALAAREQALLSLLAGPAAPFHAPPPLPVSSDADLTDNRDLNVIVSWDPPQFKDPDLQRRTLEHEIAYLRLKDCLVNGIAICIELADGRPMNLRRKQYEDLKNYIKTAQNIIDKGRELYRDNRRLSLSEPFPSRIIGFVNSPVPYRELYTCTLELVGEFATNEVSKAHDVCERVTQLVDESIKIVKQCLDKRLQESDVLWTKREILEDISNFLEYIGIITFILGICNELVTPMSTKKAKRKAANQSPDDLKTAELLARINESVQRSIFVLEEVFEKWSETPKLEDNLKQISLEDYQSPVEQKLRDGYNGMVEDIRNILKKKSKFLKSLIQ